MSDEMYLDNIMELNNCTAKIYRPVLTEEEREKRIKQFHEATAIFLYQCEKEKQLRKQRERNNAV